MNNLRPRIIPVLQISEGELYKSYKYKKLTYVGEPLNVVRIFNEKEADEMVILDINASKKLQEPDFKLIESIAGECFMPLAYGGGIKNITQAKTILNLGVEKLILKTSFYEDPMFLKELIDLFGSQSIVVSIDYKKSRFSGKLISVDNNNKKIPKRHPIIDALKAQEIGVGEIILNNTILDGTLEGLSIELAKDIKNSLNIPVLNMGGANSLSNIKFSIEAGFSGVVVGSYFTFHGIHKAVLISYPDENKIYTLLN